MKNIFTNSLLAAVAIILPWITVEIALSVSFREDITKARDNKWSYRSQSPPPPAYSDANYLSREFLEESRKSVEFTPELKLKPKSGTFFNVNSKGFRETKNRYTSNNKKSEQYHIYIFGGSTIFSEEVPDELTIPSLLSKRLNESCGSRFNVHNRGIPASRTDEQLSLLKDEKLPQGSMVIFYDGFNDFHYNFHRDNPTFKSHFELAASIPPPNIFVGIPIINESATYKFLTKQIGSDLSHQNTVLAKAVSRRYWQNIKSANELVKSLKSTFLHFIQPVIHTSRLSTDAARYLVDHPTISSSGESISYERYYDIFRGNRVADPDGYSYSHDLSFSLKSLDASEYFLDHVHVNEKANELIAKIMYTEIQNSWDALNDCVDSQT